jgi:Right handed beta helix region
MTAVASRGGGTVRLPRGTFSGNISIPDGVTVVGAGMDASHIKGKVYFGSNVVVRDIRLGDSGYTVRNLAGASNTLFERVRFRGGGGSGSDSFVVMLGGGTASCDHITFKDCTIERNLGVENSSFSNGYDNVWIQENGAPGGAHVGSITFDGCHFGVSNGVKTGCPRMDLEIYTNDGATRNWGNITVTNCIFEVSDWLNIDLSDEYLSDSQAGHGGPVLISGCTLKGGSHYTICVESAYGTTIENNTIYRGGSSTIKMGRGDMTNVNPGTIIRNNVFPLTTDNGLTQGSITFYLEGGGNQFTGNTVMASPSNCLFAFDQARNNTVTGNTFTVPAGTTLVKEQNGSSGNILSPNTVN